MTNLADFHFAEVLCASRDFLIIHLNSQGKNVYCDWISDSDYLKRNLVREATLKVIEKRLEQSKAILFVNSNISSTISGETKFEK